jgi:hypothetical protein
MATNHDIASYKSQRIFLENFRTGIWKNTNFSKNLIARRTNKNWPSEDGNIYDNSHKNNIALEFKPLTETKRGIQTGLGQCITYLNNFSCSYLICPDQVEDFKISEYMKNVFNKEIYGKLPIGLIEHSVKDNDLSLKLLVDISEKLSLNSSEQNIKESRYWAKYIDTNPHLIYLLLKISKEFSRKSEDRDHEIWSIFFDKYYFPKNARNLQPYESVISHFNLKKIEPFRDTKKKLLKMVENGEFTKDEAIKELKEHCYWDGKPLLSKSKTGTDNLFRSYKKNYLKNLDHMEVWDSNYFPTKIGEDYIKIGEKYGPNSVEMLKYFGKTFLENGNHFDLILDLDNSVKEKTFNSSNDARVFSQKYMEEKGLYKRNTARATVKGRTKLFSNEFQLWNKLELFRSNKSYISGTGYDFNWEKIDYYLS